MSTDDSGAGPAPGLCGNCAHARVIRTRKGGRFFLCLLSRVDPRFRRYPQLPVLECSGFRAGAPKVDLRGEGEKGEATPPGRDHVNGGEGS